MRFLSLIPTTSLLLLTISALKPLSSHDKPGSVSHLASDKSKSVPGPANVPLPASAPEARPEKGTKDAPVDGLDGKPHSGPFLEGGLKPQVVEDLGTVSGASAAEKAKVLKETFEKPDEDPGVMREDMKGDGAKVKGPTGTEGGVSSKGKGVGGRPGQPKEAVSLESIEGGNGGKDKTTESVGVEKKKGAAGLEKPDDLPEKPHDIPHPVPKYMGGTPHGKLPTPPTKSSSQSEGVLSPIHSLFLSFTMIIVSEIGDKTFLIAALMAMRHPRQLVFSAAFSALVCMTVLSALLGHAVPTLLPKRFTAFAAAGLFLFFGVKLVREGLAMPKDAGVGEEMLEVEQELEEKEAATLRQYKRPPTNGSANGSLPYIVEEARSRSPSPSRTKGTAAVGTLTSGLINLCSLLLSPAWVQTFVMTFLGEWGDRSQISTIAMAAGKDYWWVTLGAIFGHSICTAMAVVGGRAVAGKVSMRIVTLGGGIAFLVFGVLYGAESLWSTYI